MGSSFADMNRAKRTMLTVRQTIDSFKDAEGQPIFSEYMVRRLIRENKIPHVRLGNRKLLLCKETIENWLAKQELLSTAKPVENNEYGTLRKI
jgi:excisionase family DNA binding protein